MEEKKSYLGTGWHFPPVFIKSVGAAMLSGEEDIRQSLEILFSTGQGERVFRDGYGCNIRRWVFGEMTSADKTLLINDIEHAILFYEPRIETEKVDVEIKDPREGILWISITYRVRQTNSRSNLVYPFYFKEGTNL